MPLDNSHQHASSDIMYSGSPHSPLPATAGAAQQLSRLGPVSIAFADISGAATPTGFVIPAGAVVTAFAVIKTNGDGADPSNVTLALYPSGDLSAGITLIKYDMFNGYYPPQVYGQIEPTGLNSTDPTQVLWYAPSRSAVAITECTIGVTGTGLSAPGVIDVYALIATPA